MKKKPPSLSLFPRKAGGDVNDAVLNSYCWMYATFNIPLNFRGVCSKREHDGSTLYNTYYQWVSIFLGTQALVFYIPRCIWLLLEGGLMSYIVKGERGKGDMSFALFSTCYYSSRRTAGKFVFFLHFAREDKQRSLNMLVTSLACFFF